jgi:C-terminal peptidase prc
MSVKTPITMVFLVALIFAAPAPARAQRTDGVDVRMPLVEATLRFIKAQALAPPNDAALLRAAALRICGEKVDGEGCLQPHVRPPKPDATGPDATRRWRQILESALGTQRIKEGDSFDATAFQRYLMDAMVEALSDPNSFYIVPSVYKKIASIPSDFVGFGLRVVPTLDKIKVVAVHPGSPAARAGILAGEHIISVLDKPVTGYHRPGALAAIWGAYGKKIRLGVEHRDGSIKKLDLEYASWTFDSYKLRQINGALVVEIQYFERGLAAAVRNGLSSDIKGIVIDLRDAGSGDAGEMAALADILIKDGAIGEKRMRSDLGSRKWTATESSDGERPNLPLAVIINHGTGGLSEVLAACLRTHVRGILVGQTTSGHDTLESMMAFDDGSAVQVTSTRLLGPDGCDFSDGIDPHVESPRADVDDLAVRIVENATGPAMDDLIKAAKKAVNHR